MIEDIVKVKAFNIVCKPIKRHPVHRVSVIPGAKFHPTYTVIFTRTTEENISTYLATVQA